MFIIMYRLAILFVVLAYFLYQRQVIPEEYYFRFLGAFMMIFLEVILLLIWVVIKIRQLFRQYNFRITLVPNSVENDPSKLNWKVQSKDDLFMNKYTEQGKLALRTNEAKERAQFDSNFAQTVAQSDISSIPLSTHIQNTQILLQTLDKSRNIMNCFNSYPNQFGYALSNMGLNNQLNFVKVQEHHPCTIQVSEITDNEQQLLKNNRINGGNILRLPGWGKIIWFFGQMGTTLRQYLKEMQQSNIKLISLSYHKIQEEDQMLCSEITMLQKQIESTKKILRQLSEEEHRVTKAQQYQQLQPQTAEAHQKWLYWLKKRYLQFINLEQSIKQNQNKLKVMRQKVKHYRQNLTLLSRKHRNLYNSTLKISLRGFLDSVYNALQKSFESFNLSLRQEHVFSKWQKTKVEQLKISTNVHEMIQAEKKYQQQYFQRVQIHIEQATTIQKAILDLSYFLQSLIHAYQQFQIKIKGLIKEYQKQELAKFHIRIFQAFSQANNKFIVQLETFSRVNNKFIDNNLHQLRLLISKITRYKETAQYQLAQLEKQSKLQNVIYKYKAIQERLLSYYECLEEHIQMVVDFRRVYLTHTNRIKKSLLMFVYEKLMDQKKVVQSLIYRVDSKTFRRQTSQIDIQLSNQDQVNFQQQEEIQKYEEQGQEQTKQQIQQVSPSFLGSLNKLLFACYTEWSVSHFFKSNIYESLYKSLNDQPPEDFSQILISSVGISGPPPRLNSLKLLKSEQKQCLMQLNLSFYGSINLEINTSYKIFQSVIPLSCRAHITEMNLTSRVCFVISSLGSGWFSFIGEPAVRIDVIPAVGSFTIDYAAVRKLIQNFVMNLLKKNVYPMKSSLRVPLYGEIQKKQVKKGK